jgi:hypothetical protein
MKDMLHKTKIGVCMDAGIAYLLEEKNDENVITIIEAEQDKPAAEDSKYKTRVRNEKAFYKKVFDFVKDFDKVALFGPAKIKNELINRIRANEFLKIEIQNNPIEDKITENQKIDFINQYFST